MGVCKAAIHVISGGSLRALVRAIGAAVALFVGTGCDQVLGIDAPHARVVNSGGTTGAGTVGPNTDAPSVGGSAAAAAPASATSVGGAGGIRATGGAAGVGAGAGEGGDSGDGGDAGWGGGGISINVPDPTSLCPGTAIAAPLTAAGGQPPYTWALLDSPPGFSLSPSGLNQEQATVTASTVPGVYTLNVRVTDGDGASALKPFSVSVRDVPVIRETSVPSVCPNELYSAALTADGGDASSYTWSTDLPASTGLAIAGAQLRGKFVPPSDGSTHVDFTLSVLDSGACPSAPVALALNFDAPTATACTAVDVANQVPNTPPPKPCLGNAYSEQLVPRRGVGPYEWSASSLPAGLSFNANTETVSGTATAAGTLTIQLKDDGTGRTTETSYALQPRDKCWFAYVSSETGSSALHFFDALLGNRKTLPAGSSDDLVSDFKFSPNGQFVAYAHGAAGGPAGLSIVKLATWQEQQLSFSGVTHYAWSADSSILAVAYSVGADTVLGGADVALALSAPPGGIGTSTPIVFPTLSTTPAAVDSEPVWYGGTNLAFFTPFFAANLWLDTTPLQVDPTSGAPSGFGSPATHTENIYAAPVQLRPAASGLWVIPQVYAMVYYARDSIVPVLHNDVVISPSGRYVARADQHDLALFRASDTDTDSSSSVNAPDTARARAPGCDTVLTWAAGTERIACAHQVPNSDDELLLFDVATQTDTLSAALTVPLNVPYPDSAHVQRRRLFSASGARLALAAADTLSVVTLGADGPKADYNVALAPADSSPNNAFAELAFSPNELLLLQHRGGLLSFFDLLNATPQEVVLSSALAPSVLCDEDFRDGTAGWCGVERPGAPFMWSPDSNLAAFQTAAGTLQIYDLSLRALGIFTPLPVNDQCNQACVVAGQFGFQP